MTTTTIALFGEAERGNFQTAYFCNSLPQLLDTFGNPPTHSLGLHYAVEFLLAEYHLIYFRVLEEGYSQEEYLEGLEFLQGYRGLQKLDAICLPGVGARRIIDAVEPLHKRYNSLLIIGESDFYDYLTDSQEEQMSSD